LAADSSDGLPIGLDARKHNTATAFDIDRLPGSELAIAHWLEELLLLLFWLQLRINRPQLHFLLQMCE